MAKKITITEVARQARVSISTVSRVLNQQHTGDPEVRERVLKVVEDLGFQPNTAARSLAGRGSGTRSMSFLMQSLTPPGTYYGDVMRGAEDEAHRLEANLYFSTVYSTLGVMAKPGARLKGLSGEAVQGLIFAGEMPEEFLREVKQAGVPIVYLNSYPWGETVNCVMCDNFLASYRAVQWLVELGHRRIACIACGIAPHLAPSMEERVMGYRQALFDADIPFDPALFRRVDSTTIQNGYEAMEHLIQVAPRPTAVFGVVDEVAVGAVRCARDAGLRVPENFSILGVNDLDISQMCDPPLTTIRIFQEEIGRIGIQRLRELIKNPGQRPRRIDVFCELVVRESCAESP